MPTPDALSDEAKLRGQPLIDVIVPVKNDWNGLQRTVAALERQDLDRSLWSLTIVDNGSAKPPAAPLQIPENATFIQETAPGSYSARNLGIRSSISPYLAFTDAGCIPEPKWLTTGLAVLTGGNRRVAGRVRVFSEATSPSFPERYEILYAFDQQRYVRRGVAATANFFARREHFDHVGVFDASLLSGGDFEWNHRASRAGIPIIFSSATVVWHPARSTLDELLEKDARVWSGKLAFGEYSRLILLLGAGYRALVPPLLSVPSIVLGRDSSLVNTSLRYRVRFSLWLQYARWRILAQRIRQMYGKS